MKKSWKRTVLVLLPFAALLVLLLVDPNTADIGSALEQISPLWLLGAVACILLYYLCDTGMYYLACRSMRIPQKFIPSIVTTMIGFFYSALTPFSTGGQPMQVLQMRKRGITVGTATSVLAVKFLGWQLAITLLGVMGFLFIPQGLKPSSAGMTVMFWVGFCVYLFSVVLALFVFFKPEGVYHFGKRVLNFIGKWRVMQKKDRLARAQKKWETIIQDFAQAATFAKQHVFSMLFIMLLSLLSAVSYMSVTYFIYRGFGLAEHPLWHVVLMQAFLYIAVSFVPLPGASIASEGGFYVVFSQLFTPAARFPAALLWRLLTYYFALALGGIFVMIDGASDPEKQRKKKEIQEPKRGENAATQ